ncbi:lipopolysaccharide assembly protein LapB [Pseudomaricurvus alkylphenolicus]|uniref:lipopolysaccharide assembly protein LapB n=1 Tax=Pseudomaricurvus alkylphenolicus TaxID=1306991 RepID=UPI001421612E|nr:lipopolysaccharide assembly protein LapB [Pseudomaricurvus alkylphenolicus]NIB42075.1 lipopolysaccharide assembly protein LapB [Pseudomaricurvus alkylphenolicus]
MIDWGLLLLVLLAIAIGYALGWRSRGGAEEPDAPVLEPHYIQGLNYLLNEQPDAAIDTFIGALDVNSETLETHLALGNLLRKRGEVSRAIKIHQNLLARPGLEGERSKQVQLELARDFIKSGLLDRAEMLLQELAETSAHPLRTQCLEYLIEIYRDEKEWQKAIDAINQLSSRRFARLPDRWRMVQSHFFCELAEDALRRTDYLGARRQLRAAALADKQSARPSLLLAELEHRLGQDKEAIRTLKQVFHQDPSLLPEALPLLSQCHKSLGIQDQLREYLHELLEQGGSTPVVMALAELIADDEGSEAAARFLGDQVSDGPSLLAVGQMLQFQLSDQREPDENMLMASNAIRNIQKTRPHYRCYNCGFSGQQMHWLCPGCKTWGSVKPVE